MAKLEVQVRHCFCCGLTPGSVLIGIYTLLLYALLTGLAAWALSETAWNGDKPIFESCDLEAQGKNRTESRKITFSSGRTTVVVEDSSSYHCSFGMYTEEMKFTAAPRYVALLIALCLYVPLILASIILLASIALSSEWLLLPWLVLFLLDIIRGLVSSVLILVFSYLNLARIATGIFFLGLQFLHISLWILILAKFQRIHHRRKGTPIYDGRPPMMGASPAHLQQPYYGPGPMMAPHGPESATNYGYSPQSARRGELEYAPPHSQHRYDQPTRY